MFQTTELLSVSSALNNMRLIEVDTPVSADPRCRVVHIDVVIYKPAQKAATHFVKNTDGKVTTH